MISQNNQAVSCRRTSSVPITYFLGSARPISGVVTIVGSCAILFKVRDNFFEIGREIILIIFGASGYPSSSRQPRLTLLKVLDFIAVSYRPSSVVGDSTLYKHGESPRIGIMYFEAVSVYAIL